MGAGTVDLELLIGSLAFWDRARRDIAAARRRVLVQAMSFEGDAAGLAVAVALRSSPAKERRVLIDDYTRVNINDRPVASRIARRDAALRAEVAATAAMFRDLIDAGVPVRVTNPILPFGLNYPCRNHKKLVVADDVAYLGGVNFSEHNFAWPDMMLRIDSSAAADFLSKDFDRTSASQGAPSAIDLDGLSLRALDGRSNRDGFDAIFKLISAARRRIVVVSPYLTAPFTDRLAAAVRAGVEVRVLTPWPNNKPIVRDALLGAARRHGFKVVLGPVMSHLKGILVDDETLVLGSSNFDFASLAAEEEFLAIVSNEAIIKRFQTLVVEPAMASAIDPAIAEETSGRASELALRAAAVVASAARALPRRAIDWPR